MNKAKYWIYKGNIKYWGEIPWAWIDLNQLKTLLL